LEIRAYTNGVGIIIYVAANARKELLFVRSDNNLGIKVGAPAQENKANNRIIELLSQYLGIAKSNMSIRKGEHAKKKELFISDYNYDQIVSLLEKALNRQ
jgi:uncharacterized protein (TIGR00251 family)